MGTGVSRPGGRHPIAAKVKRRLTSLVCGSSCSRATAEAEDYPVESLVNPAGFSHTVPVNSQEQQPIMSVLSSSEGIGLNNPEPEQGYLSESGTLCNNDLLFDSAQNNIESASKQKYPREVDESKPAQNHNKESKSSQPIHGDTTSTSESSRDGDTEIILANDAEELANNDPPQTSTGVPSPVRLSGQELMCPHLAEAEDYPVESLVNPRGFSHTVPVNSQEQHPMVSVLSSSEGIGFNNPEPEQGYLSESGTLGNKNLLFDSAQSNIESASKQKYPREVDESKPAHSHNKESKSSQPIHGDTTSTPESSRDGDTEIILANDAEELANNDPPQTSTGVPSPVRLLGQELLCPHLAEAEDYPVESLVNPSGFSHTVPVNSQEQPKVSLLSSSEGIGFNNPEPEQGYLSESGSLGNKDLLFDNAQNNIESASKQKYPTEVDESKPAHSHNKESKSSQPIHGDTTSTPETSRDGDTEIILADDAEELANNDPPRTSTGVPSPVRLSAQEVRCPHLAEAEDYPVESLVNPTGFSHIPVNSQEQQPMVSVLSSSEGIGFNNPEPEQGYLSESGTLGNKDLLFDSAQSNIESASKQKYPREVDESKPAHNHNKENKFSQPIHGDTTSTSESSKDGDTVIFLANDAKELANNDPPQTSTGVPSPVMLSGQELRCPRLAEAEDYSVESLVNPRGFSHTVPVNSQEQHPMVSVLSSSEGIGFNNPEPEQGFLSESGNLGNKDLLFDSAQSNIESVSKQKYPREVDESKPAHSHNKESKSSQPIHGDTTSTPESSRDGDTELILANDAEELANYDPPQTSTGVPSPVRLSAQELRCPHLAEAEDYPVESLVNPAGFSHTVPIKSQEQHPKVSVLSSSEEIRFNNPKSEQGYLSESGTLGNKDLLFDSAQNNIESASKQKYPREVDESKPAHSLNKERKSSQLIHGDTTSPSESSRDGDTEIILANDAEELANNDPPQTSTGVPSPVRLSAQELRCPHLGRTDIESRNNTGIGTAHATSAASPIVSSSNICSQSPEHDNVHEVVPSGLRFLMSDRMQGSGEGNLFHVDVMSISSSNSPGNNNAINTREARQNSRRMIWDAFSSRSSRRQTDISTPLFATDDDGGVDSRRSCLPDHGIDIFNDGMSDDIRHLGRRSHFASERRWHSRSEAEDYPVESLVNPRGFSHTVPVNSQEQHPMVSVLSSSEGIRFNNPKSEQGYLSESGTLGNKDLLFDSAQNNIESASKQKYPREVDESKPAHNHNKESKSSQPIHGDTTSTSESSRDGDTEIILANDAEELANNDPPQTSTGVPSPVRLSGQELRCPHLGGTGIESRNNMGIGMVHATSVASPVVSSSNIGSQSPEDDNVHEEVPSGLRFLMSDRMQGSGEGNNNTISTREARRNRRRMFWDAFSSRSSRRQTDISTSLFATDDDGGVDSRRSWLLDYGSDIFNDGMSDDIWHLGRRSHFARERRWHSRSEFRERLRGGTSERGGGNICPSGLHPEGSCFCGLEGDSSSQSSMSRIVMFAEALVEVLNELHRQPTSFARSMLSNPAPEPTVDSLPVKSYEKSTAVESGEDVEQCNICLEEYETGDKIRVLPCTHEYHMACVDKWLKKIHGVTKDSLFFGLWTIAKWFIQLFALLIIGISHSFGSLISISRAGGLISHTLRLSLDKVFALFAVEMLGNKQDKALFQTRMLPLFL